MSFRATADTKKKASNTSASSLSIMPSYHNKFSQRIGNKQTTEESIVHGPPVGSGLSHDFKQMRVHAPTEGSLNNPAMQSCPMTSTPCACPFGGACHICPAKVQTKLAINRPGDQYEQEADRIAEQITEMSESKVFRQTAGSGTSQFSTVSPIVHEVLHSSGQPLDSKTRDFFEPRFGHDFSKVRVHTDTKAVESARAVNAIAYTVGRDVVFGAGRYSPQTNAGQKLIAHELVHSIQQADMKSKSTQNMLIQRATDFNFGNLPEDWEGGFYGPRKKQKPYTGKYVCGPDVTTPVRNVLNRMETYFSGLTHDKKVAHCEALHSFKPWVSLGAWDINPLYCNNADWLDDLTLKGVCDIPGDGQTDCSEPSNDCKHSVRDHGKCVLAGTLNYFTWGQMHRLCHNYALSAANSAASNPLNPNNWDKPKMNRYIKIYKFFSTESPSVPIAFAEAAFVSGSGAVPPVENRSQCKDLCTVKKSPLGGWTWTWYPDHVQSP